MSADGESMRKPRADSQRNRESLMAAAKACFAELGAEASLEEIARRAGVGIGTLYRHFPTRTALIEAVYRREVEQLAAASTRLMEELAPAEALRQWLHLAVDYIATKKVIAPALDAAASQVYATSGAQIVETVERLVVRAVAAGDIRADTQPADVLRAFVGFSYGYETPDWQASAQRLIDIFMDGLRPPGR